ncbi:PREDICTED: putative F-box protein At3g44060 [Camelina sativa]|uniref:F-box protein At3g44060 n=1 Tax=Camelina sativa TaxID=90675 RepID=A0ABM0SP71_CAMSA|nr:PREDICTED: putative F-box protein At3g44060 [Camelina sativa]
MTIVTLTELHLRIEGVLWWNFSISSKIFTSTTLVKLSLIPTVYEPHCPRLLPSDTSLPSLKVLLLYKTAFKDDQLSDVLLNACPVLEDLTIGYYKYHPGVSYVISSKSIKRLSVTYSCARKHKGFSRNIPFDTPNVVDFYYSDFLGRGSRNFHLGSLAKATLDLRFIKDDEQADMRDIICEIRNVKTLHLTSSTVEVILLCCKNGLPVFNNLVELGFASKEEGWKVYLPLLLEGSPNLKTLVLSGLNWFSCKRHRFTRIPPNNQIKMLVINKYQGYASELKHISHFLRKMECLEVVKVYVVAARMDGLKKMQVTEDLLKLPASSSKLKIQVL